MRKESFVDRRIGWFAADIGDSRAEGTLKERHRFNLLGTPRNHDAARKTNLGVGARKGVEL